MVTGINKEDFKAKIIPKKDSTKTAIKNKIIKSFMFSNLDNNDIDIVINAMRVVEVSKNDCIIKEKDDGDEMYVVGSGVYEWK